MVKIAVCDDEVYMTSKIENLLLELCKKKAIDLEVDIYLDGLTLARSVTRGEQYDIIYLDIEMKKCNGVEAAKSIRSIDSTVIVIYVSSFENYLKELFEVEPFRFIKKPIDTTLFEEYFDKAYKKILKSNVYFEYKFNREIIKVPIDSIMYFESSKRTINIITKEDILKFYGKLNEIENNLKPCKMTFLRVHQSFLVNYKYVKKIGYDYTELIDGTTLQISEDRQKNIRQKYCNLIGGEIID